MILPARCCQWQLTLLLLMHDHRHCVRAAKEMDLNSIGLCPQGFESLVVDLLVLQWLSRVSCHVVNLVCSRLCPSPHYALARPSTMPVAIMMNPLQVVQVQNKVKITKTNTCYLFLHGDELLLISFDKPDTSQTRKGISDLLICSQPL